MTPEVFSCLTDISGIESFNVYIKKIKFKFFFQILVKTFKKPYYFHILA